MDVAFRLITRFITISTFILVRVKAGVQTAIATEICTFLCCLQVRFYSMIDGQQIGLLGLAYLSTDGVTCLFQVPPAKSSAKMISKRNLTFSPMIHWANYSLLLLKSFSNNVEHHRGCRLMHPKLFLTYGSILGLRGLFSFLRLTTQRHNQSLFSCHMLYP